MKRILNVSLIVMGMLLFAQTMHAGPFNPPLSVERQNLIEKNILAGLQHSSQEVQCEYIQLIIDLKRAYPKYDFDYAIIPLMDKLKNESNPCVRIIAALALYEFQDSRLSRFAIQQTAIHDSSVRVARHCGTLIRKWNDRTPQPVYVAHVVYPWDNQH